MLPYRNSFLGDENKRAETETPVSAISVSACALSKSSTMKKSPVNSGYLAGSGKREKTVGGVVAPGEIRRHRKGRCYGCIGTSLLVLRAIISRTRNSGIMENLHLLKLVTGVEISTRPVRTGGKEGNAVNNSRRIATAEPNNRAFCLSMTGIACYRIENIVAKEPDGASMVDRSCVEY